MSAEPDTPDLDAQAGPEPRALPESAESSAAVMIAAGFPRIPARALMALVVSEDGALTAAELSEVLGVSAAAVSGAVRYLQTVGFVHRVAQPGSRRDRYALPEDLWYVATLRQNPIYHQLGALSMALAEDLPTGSAARARAEDMAHFYRFIAERMPKLLDEWEQERRG
ncbi:transcriptional regulator [Sinomonas cyclohexanicum]|uniref:Transcriptional regulator n=1 Tax=Sinomonas cyclohexanicum TaxID=322009 RepID=A0ABM7PSX7_SINCY|nr:MarR family transcriptional regulator [Corynebacterium cyclohexanicum]BCT75195.1 transcriptional regulator [Corynebacterium cyclohexanicum]